MFRRGRQSVLGIRCSALRKAEALRLLNLVLIQPDGSGCNSPVQRAKHTPFFAIREWQKILVN